MSTGGIDLDACETEAIHEIGAIQPEGALLAVDEATGVVTHASGNLHEYIDITAPRALNRRLADLIGEDCFNEISRCPVMPFVPHVPLPVFLDFTSVAGRPCRLECTPHRYKGRLILELEKRSECRLDLWEHDSLRQRIISDFITPGTLDALAGRAADIVREATGFDRVMVYRFAEDKHGEVIAESTNQPDSFLGLHYPASDIPEPARRHFTLNFIRIIPDITCTPSPVLGTSQPDGDDAPLDLTFSRLRAVAPVHVEYLSNMGVKASMSISLVANNQLWGLVACHHYSPHRLTSSTLRFCEIFGTNISVLMQNRENTLLLQRSVSAERMAYGMEAAFRSDNDLHALLRTHASELMGLVEAQGMVLRIGSRTQSFGILPEEEISYEAIAHQVEDGMAISDNLGALCHLSEEQTARASGAAYLQLSEEGDDVLILIREEYEQVIKWAGKPEKVETVGSDGIKRLSPRGSFALWRQERRGRSKPFSYVDREVLRIIRRALFALNSLNRERAAVRAHNQSETEKTKLRLALLEAERRGSMGELAGALAHELNQPLAAVTNFVSACRQELLNFGVEAPDHLIQLIDDAVDESSRAADLVRRLRNFIATGELQLEEVDIHPIVAQAADLAYIANGRRDNVAIEMQFDPNVPPVFADTVQIGQVVLNLVRNSLEAIGREHGYVKVSTLVATEHVEVAVFDNGPGIPPEVLGSLFEPFHVSSTSGMGMGLALCHSIIEAHGGRIWHSPSAYGAELRFTLPIEQDMKE
ncbi:MAG: GAF domain-containing protein [Alphaproteobacteria bacterium]|nr:GAF domain-containing protein [Alphaproteobacteria bacterium]